MTKMTIVGPALALLTMTLGACSGEDKSSPTVSYANDVQPILAEHCLECHKTGADGTKASGLNMESYELLMTGTQFGPIIKSGDSLSSTLNMLVEGRADPSVRMPHGKEPLTAPQIVILKTWVDEGALNN